MEKSASTEGGKGNVAAGDRLRDRSLRILVHYTQGCDARRLWPNSKPESETTGPRLGGPFSDRRHCSALARGTNDVDLRPGSLQELMTLLHIEYLHYYRGIFVPKICA